jgi:hypothetical protein
MHSGTVAGRAPAAAIGDGSCNRCWARDHGRAASQGKEWAHLAATVLGSNRAHKASFRKTVLRLRQGGWGDSERPGKIKLTLACRTTGSTVRHSSLKGVTRPSTPVHGPQHLRRQHNRE